MKKTTVRSIAIGSVALTAATAGAWFMLTSEPRKKEVLSPVPLFHREQSSTNKRALHRSLTPPRSQQRNSPAHQKKRGKSHQSL